MTDSRSATILGILAMIFWSTAIGATRYLIERMGLCAYVATSYLLSGVFLLVLTACRRGSLRSCFRLPRRYTLYSGSCFLLYCVAVNVGSMLAPSREIFVQAALVNYLWPALLLLFSLYMFGYAAKWRMLLPGLALALAGIAIASASGSTSASLVHNLRIGWAAYLLMLIAAIAWGLYSNLAKKYHEPGAPSGVPLFQLAVGMIFLFALPWVHGIRVEWSPGLCGALAYAAVFPTALAYFLWEHGMKNGNQTLLGAISFLSPSLPRSSPAGCWESCRA